MREMIPSRIGFGEYIVLCKGYQGYEVGCLGFNSMQLSGLMCYFGAFVYRTKCRAKVCTTSAVVWASCKRRQ